MKSVIECKDCKYFKESAGVKEKREDLEDKKSESE